MWAPTGGRLHIVPGTEALDANRSFLPYRQLGEKCARASGGSCPAIACRWRYVECATPVEPPRRAISCAVALVCVDQSRPEPDLPDGVPASGFAASSNDAASGHRPLVANLTRGGDSCHLPW